MRVLQDDQAKALGAGNAAGGTKVPPDSQPSKQSALRRFFEGVNECGDRVLNMGWLGWLGLVTGSACKRFLDFADTELVRARPEIIRMLPIIEVVAPIAGVIGLVQLIRALFRKPKGQAKTPDASQSASQAEQVSVPSAIPSRVLTPAKQSCPPQPVAPVQTVAPAQTVDPLKPVSARKSVRK